MAMDAHLKRMADVSLALGEAEAALDENAFSSAREHLDVAEAELDGLRGDWPSMGRAEREMVGRSAAPLRARLDAARRRLPRLVALSDVPTDEQVADPEDDSEPPVPPAAA